MTTYYTVVEINFEYNDETYYASDEESGNPVKLYKSKEKAEEEVKKLNKKHAISLIDDELLSSYGYDWEEVLEGHGKFDDVKDILEIFGLPNDLYDGGQQAQELTNEQKEELAQYISVRAYKVVPVELED